VVRDETPSGPLRIGSLETNRRARLPGSWRPLRRLPGGRPVAGDGADRRAGARRTRLRARTAPWSPGRCTAGARRVRDVHRAAGRGDVPVVPDPGGGVRGAGRPRLLVFRAGCSYRRGLEGLVRARGLLPARCSSTARWRAFSAAWRRGWGSRLLPREVVAPTASASCSGCTTGGAGAAGGHRLRAPDRLAAHHRAEPVRRAHAARRCPAAVRAVDGGQPAPA